MDSEKISNGFRQRKHADLTHCNTLIIKNQQLPILKYREGSTRLNGRPSIRQGPKLCLQGTSPGQPPANQQVSQITNHDYASDNCLKGSVQLAENCPSKHSVRLGRCETTRFKLMGFKPLPSTWQVSALTSKTLEKKTYVYLQYEYKSVQFKVQYLVVIQMQGPNVQYILLVPRCLLHCTKPPKLSSNCPPNLRLVILAMAC